LQGFNIKTKDGLDNLIAMANNEFNHHHQNRFSDEEFSRLMRLGEGNFSDFTMRGLRMVHEVQFTLSHNKELTEKPGDLVEKISAVLTENRVEHTLSDESLLLHSVSISVSKNIHPENLEFRIDPILFVKSAPILEHIVREVAKDGFRNVRVILKMVEGVGSLYETHSISARLYGTDVKLYDDTSFGFNGVMFYTTASGGIHEPIRVVLCLDMKEDALPVGTITDLVSLLFERSVLFKSDDQFYRG